MSHIPNTLLKQPTSHIASFLVASCLLLCAIGCASGSNNPLLAGRVNDPPRLSPYAQPLSQPDSNSGTYRAGRPPQADSTNVQSPDEPPSTIKSKSRITPESSSSGPQSHVGPQLGELSAPTPTETTPTSPDSNDGSSLVRGGPLQVTITGPTQAQRGDDVAFQISIQNNGSRTLNGVVVTCHLPEGLVFPDAPQRAFRQRLGQLNVDKQELLDLTLRCEAFGYHCVEFEVIADDIDRVVSESACVECAAPTATEPLTSLELTGPTERTVGSRAEFVLTLRNLTGVEQPDVHVRLQHEGVLEPREASAGAIRQPGQMEWDLGLLRVDERVQIQVEFECLSTTDETCLSASVTGRGLDLAPVEACLKTIPRKTIDLNIVDQQDPVMLGEKVTYLIHVTNAGLQSLSNASIQLQADGLQPLGLTIGNNESPTGAEYDRASGLITVSLSESLAPDATQTISLQMLATHAGAGNVRGVIQQQGTSDLISTSEPTVINPLGSSVAWDN